MTAERCSKAALFKKSVVLEHFSVSVERKGRKTYVTIATSLTKAVIFFG